MSLSHFLGPRGYSSRLVDRVRGSVPIDSIALQMKLVMKGRLLARSVMN